MKIIKLNATDSTNTFLKVMARSSKIEDFTIVVTKNQLKGKGQMGENWLSENGKNLTFSIYKEFRNLNINEQFHLNYVVSLAVFNSLKELSVPNLAIKWPNDIMSANKKLCGILIENTLFKEKIKNCIIGIGINVNQIDFSPTLIQATSIKKQIGKTIDLDNLLNAILKQITFFLSKLENKEFDYLSKKYHQNLFKINKVSSFKTKNETIFSGIIKGVSKNGKLQILTEGNKLKNFEIKEIKLL